MPADPAPVDVSLHLAAAARARPSAPAVILPGRRGTRVISCAELEEDVARIARGLPGAGLPRGTRAVLMVPPGPEFFGLVFGMLRAGVVPVVVDPGMGLGAVRRCLPDARPTAVIGVGRALLAAGLLGLGGPTVRTRVRVGGGPFPPADADLDDVRRLGARAAGAAPPPPCGDDEAAVLFTSGSTGPPRGAVYLHRNFAAQVEALRALFRFGADEIDVPTFPLFALFDPALGMTTVFPEMDPSRPARADPRRVAAAVRDHGATTMFGSPALLGPLARWCAAERVALPTLRRVISAGAPVPPRVVEGMAAAIAADGEVFTPYGVTECLPIACIGHREILGETRAATAEGRGVCVGRPAPGVDVRILPVVDGPVARWDPAMALPAGAVGEIAVRAPQASRSYAGRPDADARAKIPDARGGFLHRTGDTGYRDATGRLWLCGRTAHVVATGAGPLYPDMVEGVFNAHPAVARSALVGVGAPGSARPVLCVERVPRGDGGAAAAALPDAALRRELLELAARRPVTAPVRDVLFHRGFPVDTRHNAKIRREELAVWAAGRVRP